MPIPSGPRAKSCAGNDFVVFRNCELFLPDNRCWRSERRRYEGLVKDQVESQARGARPKTRAAATQSTRAHFPFSISLFHFLLSIPSR
jgi:hypothetical protein